MAGDKERCDLRPIEVTAMGELQAAVADACETVGSDHTWLHGIRNVYASQPYGRQMIADLAELARRLPNKVETVVEIGCGVGAGGWLFKENANAVYGIDIAGFMDDDPAGRHRVDDIQLMWRNLSALDSRMKFSFFQSPRLPFEDASVDAIIAYAVLEHVEPQTDVDILLNECRRILRPDGLMLIARLPRRWSWAEHVARWLGKGSHDHLWNGGSMNRSLIGAGFEVLQSDRVELLTSYPSVFVNRLAGLWGLSDRMLMKTPLSMFAHDIRVIARAQ
jgi:SAM-dependent methyltransferase